MNQPVNLSDLIPTQVIPVNVGWSSTQAELAARLSRTIGDLASDADLFVQRAMTVLVMRGDCRGLAWSTEAADPNNKGRTGTDQNLLCRFLKCAVLHSAAIRPSLAERVPIGLMAIDRIARSLSLLRGEEAWKFLFAHPHPIRNRLIYYQLAISSSPAYELVAAVLHEGICAKIEQLMPQAEGPFDARLGGFTNWTIQIVCAIPQSNVRDSLADYQPGEFDRIIQGAIQHIQGNRLQKGGRGAYRPASLQTLWQDWQAIFYGTARENPFRDRPNYSVRLTHQIQDAAEPERMPTDQAERRQFLDADLKLEQLEQCELGTNRSTSPKSAAVRSRAESPDSAHACLAANPSTSMSGVLPRVILAMIYEGLDNLPSDWHPLNIACARLLVMSMLHLGRRPEWLLRLRLVTRPGDVEECANPIYDPSRGAIYYLPARYLGLPSLLAPRSGMSLADHAEYKRAWRDHDLVYEKIDLIHQIILPALLVGAAQDYIGICSTIIAEQPLMAAGEGVQEGNGPLFLWMRAGVMSLVNEQIISELLNSLTCFVRRFVPEYPALRPANFTRSFDAYYAAFGMRGEYRHMVSERERYWLEMPLRYSLIGSDQVHGVHSPACNRLEHEISNERARLNLGEATTRAEGMQKPAIHSRLPETMYMGSWHVPRLDIVRKIVCVLQDGLLKPQQSNPFLFPAQARHNALTSWFVVTLALLAGPRPFEIRRIRSSHLDLNGLWLSLRGKPHVSRPAFRRIPLLPELVPQASALLGDCPDPIGRHKLGLFNDNGEFTGLTTRELNGILVKAGHIAGMELAPDFYSLRHRFRTDMLACAMPEHLLTYLMGHESRGIESRNIYLERSLDDLVPLYCQCARHLAGRYGIRLE